MASIEAQKREKGKLRCAADKNMEGVMHMHMRLCVPAAKKLQLGGGGGPVSALFKFHGKNI
jgi:hypothetical protein